MASKSAPPVVPGGIYKKKHVDGVAEWGIMNGVRETAYGLVGTLTSTSKRVTVADQPEKTGGYTLEGWELVHDPMGFAKKKEAAKPSRRSKA